MDEIAREYQFHRVSFDTNAKKWTKVHAVQSMGMEGKAIKRPLISSQKEDQENIAINKKAKAS